MADEYQAVRYAADGCAGEIDPADPRLSDGAVLASGTLGQCREAIAEEIVSRRRAHLGGFRNYRERVAAAERLLASRDWATLRWAGLDGDAEAYNESEAEGCGGWAIRPAR